MISSARTHPGCVSGYKTYERFISDAVPVLIVKRDWEDDEHRTCREDNFFWKGCPDTFKEMLMYSGLALLDCLLV